MSGVPAPTLAQAPYIGIKLRGLSHLLWFERANVEEDALSFRGSAGWGKGGAYSELNCDASLIQARLYSAELQYI